MGHRDERLKILSTLYNAGLKNLNAKTLRYKQQDSSSSNDHQTPKGLEFALFASLFGSTSQRM